MSDQILVLVVEDEALVRVVLVDVLEEAGFRVIEAEHAAAALEVLELYASQIHVLFTDIHMPGAMNGIELAHHAAASWPKVALLITSAQPYPTQSQMPLNALFLSKPYRHDRVIYHIRELARA